MASHRASGPVPRWTVHATKSLFIIEDHPAWPAAAKRPDEEVRFLGIHRETGTAREGVDSLEGLQKKIKGFSGPQQSALKPVAHSCVALLGTLTAYQESFLVLAAEASIVVDIDGQQILEVTRCEMVPFAATSPSGDTASAIADIKSLLEQHFYFSREFDMTRRLQRRLLDRMEVPWSPEESMLAADERFVWNRQLVAPLWCQGISPRWFTPVTQGFVQAREIPGRGQTASLLVLLIARRSCRRVGTRYNCRGLDDEGEVGNWVETEQLVLVRGASGQAAAASSQTGWLALTQVRGSAPLFWEQPSAMSGITVSRGPELGAVAFDKHCRLVEAEYGEALYVSLLSNKESKRETEGALTAALKEQFRMQDGLSLMHLDFHARVMGEHGFERELDALAGALETHVQRFGYLDTIGVADQPPRTRQEGIVRANCFDCLDRTNMLQCQLAWKWLQRCCSERPALRGHVERGGSGAPAPRRPGNEGPGLEGLFGALGDILQNEEGASRLPLQALLGEMWADLGDALSFQYTGAASTMGAALRQGGQSVSTLLEKGWRSVNRAYCAKFEDGARQAALELMLGRHKLLRAPTGPPEVRRAPCGQLSVAVITWNIHGRACWETQGVLESLLLGACGPEQPDKSRAPDVVVFCFQEFLELNAANVMMLGAGDEVRQAEFEAAALRAFPKALGEAYVKVRGVGMVGLYVGAFVAERIRGSIANVDGDRVRAGLYRQAGNKGAVAVRFEVAKTNICILSLHLESGNSKSAERASQLRLVLDSCFTSGRVKMPPSKHDLLAVCGDFNFRLTLPSNKQDKKDDGNDGMRAAFARSWPAIDPTASSQDKKLGCVGEGVAGSLAQDPEAVEMLTKWDELCGSNGCITTRDVLREESLMEGPVLFPPTYRMFHGQPGYDSERRPAWCDRVLHSKTTSVRRRYCAIGALTQSDHRPVAALLETQLLALPGGNATSSKPGSSARASDVTEDLLTSGNANAVAASATATASRATAANAATPAATRDMPIDLLGEAIESPAAATAAAASTAASAPAVVCNAATAPPVPTAPPPGRAIKPGSLTVGRIVLAEYKGGWYLAQVTRVTPSSCDIAWLRPQGNLWGTDAMKRYLCSTGADETMHGDNLPVPERVRLPDEAPKVAHAGVPGGAPAAATATQEAKASGNGANEPLDLLS